MRLLAADVGGTKTLVGLVVLEDGRARVEAERRYASRDFDGLTAALRRFLAEARPGAFDAVGAAVPGPVVRGECRPPHLSWVIREDALATDFGVAARLVNDFAANGLGLELLAPDELFPLQTGAPDPEGPRAVIGAGTGLGQGFLFFEHGRWAPRASEGGHADFAPRDELEIELLRWLGREFDHVSYDRVLSGSGLARVHRFLLETGRAEASAALTAELAAEDAAAVITRQGLDGTDAGCSRALDVFASIYGAEAGNLALRVVATGGVYLAGGVAPRIRARLAAGGFMRAFLAKGRMTPVLAKIPVHVVLNGRLGLLGAALAAARQSGS